MRFGVSQIDGGTVIELGGYAKAKLLNREQDLNREQFKINDDRSLNQIIDDLLDQGYLPSFCTACYRKGRTGEHFMEFSVPGFIKRYCSPNAILTLTEYLIDYATPEVQEKGWKAIDKEIAGLEGHMNVQELKNRIERIKNGERDIYF
jgi:2-iminoacetate synthase